MTLLMEPEPKAYKLEMTRTEWQELLSMMGYVNVTYEKPILGKLFCRLADLRPWPVFASEENPIGPGKAAAQAILSPPAQPSTPVLSDHWQKKKPAEYETVEAQISKIEEKPGQNGPYLKITWQNQGRGFSYGSVFDEALFPFVKSMLQKRTTFYTVKAGKFTNVVGIRA